VTQLISQHLLVKTPIKPFLFLKRFSLFVGFSESLLSIDVHAVSSTSTQLILPKDHNLSITGEVKGKNVTGTVKVFKKDQ